MRAQYDFSNSKPNPYAKRLKKQITINLSIDSISILKPNIDTIIADGCRVKSKKTTKFR